MEPNAMELVVSYHQSGRYTLIQKSGKAHAEDGDGDGPLFGNLDKGEFYRAVAQRLADRVKEGWSVTYKDTSQN
jgi:hypothetical protein